MAWTMARWPPAATAHPRLSTSLVSGSQSTHTRGRVKSRAGFTCCMWPQAARSSRGACEQSLSYWYDCGWLHEYMAHECLKSSLAFRKPAVAGWPPPAAARPHGQG